MKTEVIILDKYNIDIEKIRYAAEVIKGGGLVAFPTETVYGLGANALDENAVRKIFEAKGRPADNPLIVHVANRHDINELVKSQSAEATAVMEKYWPGPITIVLHKSCKVPNIVSAGLETVAVRMPAHPIAIALINESMLPIAAPSANTSGRPSPTTARHVIDDLIGKVDIIIDGGSASVGLESTVIDMTSTTPVILRPGGISKEQLENILQHVDNDPYIMKGTESVLAPKSPGMKYTHYAPLADVLIVEGAVSKVAEKIISLVAEYSLSGVKVGVLATDQTINLYNFSEIISLGDRTNPETIAANLFASLREFDRRGVSVILAEAIDGIGIGIAIMNRMNKAAGYNIIRV